MRFVYTRAYKRQFKKLPREVQEKVIECLALFITNEAHPLLNNHSLRFEWSGYRSINVTGDYRLIFKKESRTLVRLEQVGTHGELYEA